MVEAYVLVMTAAGTAGDILPQIREIDGVRRANVVAGEFDLIAHVEADTERALLSLVTERVQTIEGVGRTRTCIVLA